MGHGEDSIFLPLYMWLEFENHWCGSFLYFSELMGSGLDAGRCDSLNSLFECIYYCLIRDLVAIEDTAPTLCPEQIYHLNCEWFVCCWSGIRWSLMVLWPQMSLLYQFLMIEECRTLAE
jgi:hypothetical protein